MDRLQNLDYVNTCLLADCGQRGDPLPPALEDKQQLMRMLMNIREPIPASDRFLRAQDAELQLQLRERGVVTLAEAAGDGARMCLWQGDITRLEVDAIVNAANSQGLGCWRPMHACIDNCIHSAAGIQLRLECQRQLQGGRLATSVPMLTPGFNLPARHVLHVVGPIVEASGIGASSRGGCVPPLQRQQLADCYTNCLDLAAARGLHSVAFPCISTGVFCFPNALAATTAVAAVRRWMDDHQSASITVIFNVFKDMDNELYSHELGL